MCDRFPRKFDVQTLFKFPRATYHTIVPSTDELYCFNSLKYENLQPKITITTDTLHSFSEPINIFEKRQAQKEAKNKDPACCTD